MTFLATLPRRQVELAKHMSIATPVITSRRKLKIRARPSPPIDTRVQVRTRLPFERLRGRCFARRTRGRHSSKRGPC